MELHAHTRTFSLSVSEPKEVSGIVRHTRTHTRRLLAAAAVLSLLLHPAAPLLLAGFLLADTHTVG